MTPDTEQRNFPKGSRLGPYEIGSSIGAGGMGEVFRARDTRLNRDVAVKVLPKDFAADAERLRRFEQEAKTLAALNHPNVLTIHDAGVHEGAPYLVSELLEGKTLHEELRGGALPVRKATDYALQIAQGLAAAHGRGVVHRDLKPDNVFVTKDGRVKILDFGLAKLRAVQSPKSKVPSSTDPDAPTVLEPAADQTEPGRVMGTPSYMAPEQVRGEAMDHRADIFAFGCVLYEMLGGRRAFRRNTPVESMNAVLNDAPPELGTANPGIPAALARIVHRCLEKEPDNRFQSAKDLAYAIEATREQGSPGGVGSQTGSSLDWRRFLTVLGIAVPVLFAVWLVFGRGDARKSALPTNNVASIERALTTGRIRSLLVKPLDNFSGDTNQGFFVDGMTEELITRLSKISALTKVISRTTAMQYRNTKKTVPEIARELQVDGVLEGSVLLSGSQVRITVKLIDGASDRNLWAESYTRDVTNVLRLQNEVALAVVREVNAVLKPEEQAGLTTAEPINADAYRAYLEGRFHWSKRNEASIRLAIEKFQAAIGLAPNYADAYAGLADGYMGLTAYSYEPALVWTPRARAALEKALALNPKLAEAHTGMAMIAWRFDYDWVRAEQSFQQAFAIDPNYPPANYWYAILLASTGRGPEALRHLDRAVETDPLSPVAHWHVGYVNIVLRRYDVAIAALEKLLTIDPGYGNAYTQLGEAYFLKGDEARSFAAWINPAAPSKVSRAAMETAYRSKGMRGVFASEAEEVIRLRGQGQVRAVSIAERLVASGDTERALHFLEQAYANRNGGLTAIMAYPFFDSLRSEPRFQALVKKVGPNK